MADLLIITTLDVLGRRNNREHHALRHLAPHFDAVTVVYRRRGASGKGWAGLMRSDRHLRVIDGISYIAVDPLLNPPEGTLRNFSGTGRALFGRLRRGLGLIADSAGILRDRLTIAALTDAARAALRPERATICEAFGPWAAAAAERLCREGRLSHHVYIDRDYEPGFMASPLRRHWAERSERRAARAADLTLSIGHRLAARFADVAGARVALSPTGVDCALFNAVVRRTPKPDLIFIGQVAPWSGIEEALGALALLTPVMTDLRLRIFGPADSVYRSRLERMIQQAGLARAVIWAGERPREEVAAALATAGIGLAVFRPQPLRIHAAPLKLLEYMASGLPVLALEGSEAGDMVARSGTGLTCACTAEGIAAAITRMMEDPETYCQSSAAGPAVAAEHDWARIMQREFALLTQVHTAAAKPAVKLTPEAV